MSEHIDELLKQRRALSEQIAEIDNQVINSGVSWRHVAAQIAECGYSRVLAVLLCRKQEGGTLSQANEKVTTFIQQLKS